MTRRLTSSRLMWVLQAGVIALVLWFAANTLGQYWGDVRTRAGLLRPQWGGIVGSALLVLGTYALLVESWRTLVRAWGDRLTFGDAARIWAVSNLGRYVPGKLWSIGAMGLLAQRAGVSPVAAAGSAVIGTVVNLAVAPLVVLLAGGDAARALFPALGGAAAWLPVAAGAALLALPIVVRPTAALVSRLLRRPSPDVRLPARVLAVVVAANVLAWVGYGLAFRWLAASVAPVSGSNHLSYVAVFAGSYLAGYLALVVPGGLVVRETALTAALVRLGLADVPTATVLAVVSRLWLTALELLPGLLFLAGGSLRPFSRPATDAKA